jgi:hypothetical protein
MIKVIFLFNSLHLFMHARDEIKYIQFVIIKYQKSKIFTLTFKLSANQVRLESR